MIDQYRQIEAEAHSANAARLRELEAACKGAQERRQQNPRRHCAGVRLLAKTHCDQVPGRIRLRCRARNSAAKGEHRNRYRNQRKPERTGVAARHLGQRINRRGKCLRLAGNVRDKVIVAPNSPMLRAKDRIIPAMMPGSVRGSVITTKTHAGPAPRDAAASSRRRSTASIKRRIARTISGKPITAHASAAPVQRKAKTMPKYSSRT